MNQKSSAALSLVLLITAGASSAHTVWLEPVTDQAHEFRVLFGGHAGKLETYQPDKLKNVEAIDAAGSKLSVARMVETDGIHLDVKGAPALIAMHFENGIHSRGATGPSVEKPMNEVPGATQATNAVKYHKTVLIWSAQVTRPLGQPFEVVPLDGAAPVAGRPLRVKVLANGKPVAGIRLGRGEEGGAKDPVTDAQGVAAFIPATGFNKLWAGQRTQVTDNAAYTELSYEYLFGFNAK